MGWGLFRKEKKELTKLNNNVSYAFSRVSGDIMRVQQWISHLHERNSSLEKQHASHVELTRRDIDNLSRWVHYLRNHNLELQKYLKELTGHLISMQERDNKLSERLSSLENEIQGHLRTQKGTTTGQVKDKSLDTKTSISGRNETKEVFVNKPSLNGAQLELLNVFYESDRPLSYNELAKILGKKNKSVRNLIYEIREKGLDIKSKFVGLRKKGFYLSKEEKIQLTGR